MFTRNKRQGKIALRDQTGSCPTSHVAQQEDPQTDTTEVAGSDPDPDTEGKRGNRESARRERENVLEGQKGNIIVFIMILAAAIVSAIMGSGNLLSIMFHCKSM